ncbi:hypothetical protein [Burkholderia phage FLC9]|nr:hypothetical protein [Burkholderia phage FLC9]
MEAPVNILVESTDPHKANLVGKAIAEGLRSNYGFERVMHAHVLVDEPEARSWTVSTVQEQEESILQAMHNLNPGIAETPVTILSRVNNETPEVDFSNIDKLAGKPAILLQGIGEEGDTFEQLREKAWQAAQPRIQPLVDKFVEQAQEFFDTNGLAITKIDKF